MWINRSVCYLLAAALCLSVGQEIFALAPDSGVKKVRNALERIEGEKAESPVGVSSLLQGLKDEKEQPQLGTLEPMKGVDLIYDGPIRIWMGSKRFEILSRKDFEQLWPKVKTLLRNFPADFYLVNPDNPERPMVSVVRYEKLTVGDLNSLVAPLLALPPESAGMNFSIERLGERKFHVHEMVFKLGISYAVEGAQEKVATDIASKVFKDLLGRQSEELEKGDAGGDHVGINIYVDSVGRRPKATARASMEERVANGELFKCTLTMKVSAKLDGHDLSGSLDREEKVPPVALSVFQRIIAKANAMHLEKLLESAKRLFRNDINDSGQIPEAQDRAAKDLCELLVKLTKNSPGLCYVLALDSRLCSDNMDKILLDGVVLRLHDLLKGIPEVVVVTGTGEDLRENINFELSLRRTEAAYPGRVIILTTSEGFNLRAWTEEIQKINMTSVPPMLLKMDDPLKHTSLQSDPFMSLIHLAVRTGFRDKLDPEKQAFVGTFVSTELPGGWSASGQLNRTQAAESSVSGAL